ncbi:MAG: flavodoxin family protein [Deltaproteobacteria bacterium]|jgi:multimeric flavodoxin WrbA|nr:flavodoxin family protein [Deltaproteobacteria bacterium]
MKVVAVLGSPRVSSNSALLAQAAIKTTGAEAEDVRCFFLHELNIKGCQGCYSCKNKTETCIVTDDLSPVLSAAGAADLVILTAPIYIGDISAQQKIFIDRTFSWFKPDFEANPAPGRLEPGKRLLFITTQFQPDLSLYTSRIDFYLNYFQNQGFQTAKMMAANLGDKEDVSETRPDLFRTVEVIVTSLLNA